MVDVSGKNVFISGPMTGYENYNERAFTTLHIRLKLLGAETVYNPILQWVCEPQRISEKRTHESYMLECVQEISRMRDDGSPFYDMLVQLPGWRASEGARVEDVVAESCGIERVPAFDVPHVEGVPGLPSMPCVPAHADRAERLSGVAAARAKAESEATAYDESALWPSWDASEILWVNSDATHGERETRVGSRSQMPSPHAVAIVVAMQRELEKRGIRNGDVAVAKVAETGSVGMNAFVSHVACDLSLADGGTGRLSFDASGPAVPSKSMPYSEQLEIEGVSWLPGSAEE